MTMTGTSALQYGQYYHIYNRGNNGENVFLEERNYRYFLELYAHHVGSAAETFAYFLLHNHFHLLVRILTPVEQTERRQTLRVPASGRLENPKGLERVLKPSQQFLNLFSAFSKAISKAYDRSGSLFEHPFRRVPVTSQAQLTHLVVYIHQNPVKHGFVADLSDWPYSSYHTARYLGNRLAWSATRSWIGSRDRAALQPPTCGRQTWRLSPAW
jgi:putative transposase